MSGDSLAITFFGHSTLLVEAGGVRILTDPLFRRWLGPIGRVCPVPDVAALAPVDAVLISHMHHDHLDLPSLAMLPPGVSIVAPKGSARVFAKGGFNATELPRGESIDFGGTKVRAVEAVHSGKRMPRGPIGEAIGYMIESPFGTVYFAGDTALFEGMARLHPEIDVALLPVWGWGPRLRGGHLDPERAARAVELSRPRVAIPIHWGTYWPRALGPYRRDRLTRPPHEFASFVREQSPHTEAVILQPSERWQRRDV